MKALPALLCAAISVSPTPALGQWTVDKTATPAGQADARACARVHSKKGHTLRIYLDAANKVWAELVLPSGLSQFASRGCPTYWIEEGTAHTGTSPGGACEVRGRAVRFELGELQEKRVRSAVLSKIMNGSYLEMVFHLHALGYERARFSLRGSKQAINRMLGGKVRVTEG